MNRKLKKQIKTYAGAAGLILGTEKINAQVVYHDIVPDDTVSLPNNYFLYDFNNDGITDIYAWATDINLGSASNSPHLGLIYLYSNYIQKNPGITGCVNRSFAFMHNPLDTIPGNIPSNSFVHRVDLEHWIDFFGSSTSSCFQAADSFFIDKCIAVKFNIPGQMHYAWMRIELLNRKVVIKDYAYQLQPNVSILACDTTNLATNIIENNFSFNFSQQNNFIHISSFQKSNRAIISVYDLLGKEILQQPFEGKEITITIDKKGIYFVEVRSEKGIFRKKVFVY